MIRCLATGCSKGADFFYILISYHDCINCIAFERIIGNACPFSLLVTRPWKYVHMLVKSSKKLKKKIIRFSLLFNLRRFTEIWSYLCELEYHYFVES